MRAALARLDARGRFRRADLPELRALVGHAPAPDHPVELLGPWHALDDRAREALRSGTEHEFRGMLAARPRGRAWLAVVRALHAVDRRIGPGRRWPSIVDPGAWAQRLWSRPVRTRNALAQARRRRRWRAGRSAGPLDLLAALGFPPTWLIGDYLEGVSVDPRVFGFRADPGSNALAGYLIGLDLVHAPDGVWCLEANLNAALRDERAEFYDRDPIVIGLLDFAKARGLERLVWFGAGQAPLCGWLLDEFTREAPARGLGFELVESPRLPARDTTLALEPPARRAAFPPAVLPSSSLWVRVRSYGCGPDLVIGDKDLFIRGMETEVRGTCDERVRVPRMSRDPGEVAPPAHPGLPNVVYKYPNEDRGVGVHFLRADDADHARVLARELDRRTGEPPGRFQPFVCSHLLGGRRFYDVRAFVFVSPAGVVYLGGLRKEAGTVVPERLASGIVEDRRPFSMSGFLGRTYRPLGPEDEQPIESGALAVGEALARLLARGFRTPG